MQNVTIDQNHIAEANVTDLRVRLEKLMTSQQRMQRVNSYVRNRNVRGLKEMGYTNDGIAALVNGAFPHQGRVLFSTYKLDYASAQIRAVRAEIAAAEMASGEIPSQVETDTYTCRHDAQAVTFWFLSKPDKGTRAALRRFGFVRSGGEFRYSRECSSDVLRAVASVRRVLDV